MVRGAGAMDSFVARDAGNAYFWKLAKERVARPFVGLRADGSDGIFFENRVIAIGRGDVVVLLSPLRESVS